MIILCNSSMKRKEIFRIKVISLLFDFFQGNHSHNHHHNHTHNGSLVGDQLNWSVATESAVDSSFFWGYLITQVPGGFLASVYPSNRIFGTAICCSAFLNLFLPGAFEFPAVIIMIRVLQGLVEVNIIKRIQKKISFLA